MTNSYQPMKITLEVPIEEITALMTSIEECKKDNRKIWKEIKAIREDITNLRVDIDQLNRKHGSGTKRFGR